MPERTEQRPHLAAILASPGSGRLTCRDACRLRQVSEQPRERSLRDHRDLTVATNSIQIPTEISPKVVRDRKHVAELTGEDITTDAIVRAIAAPESHREAAE